MESYNKALMLPNPRTPSKAIFFNPEICVGCNVCVDYCRCDVLHPNPVKGAPPIVLYPDECWFDGCCANACPRAGAITMLHPLQQKVGWIRKDTGAFYRLGMKDPPAPNTKPAIID